MVARAGLDSTRARMYRRLIAWTVWGFATVEAGAGGVERQERAASDAQSMSTSSLPPRSTASSEVLKPPPFELRRVSNDGGPAATRGSARRIRRDDYSACRADGRMASRKGWRWTKRT